MLFDQIFTVAYNVVSILEEKELSVWDRIIVSSITKWQVYMGNLIYSFLIGYVQVLLIFSIFRFGVGIEFNDAFWKVCVLVIPYLLTIVSMSVMITGFVKNTRQYQAVIPLISVSMAMIGGAYWPIEIVSSEWMIALSKFVPITYAMEVLKGATLYHQTFVDMLYPISMLLFMSIVMMGIGIHAMENKAR